MKKNTQKKEFDKSLKLIAKSSIFVFLGLFLSKLFTYFYRIVIARYYGPEIYGMFSLGMMILLWTVSFASIGIVEGVLRFIPYYRGKKQYNKIKYIFKFSIIILLISGILFGIILFLLSDIIAINIFNEPGLAIFLKFFSFLVPIYMILYLILSVIRSFEKIIAHSFIQDFFENFLKLFFIIILIITGLKTNAVIFSYVLGVIISLLVAYLYAKSKIPIIFEKHNLDNASKKEIKRKLFAYSWPLIFLGIISGILPYIDSFVIGFFKGVAEVGLYNAAVPIAGLMVLAPNIFVRLFFPLITKEFSKKNYHVVSELSKQVEKWILILNLPLFFLIIIFPGAFINLLFGIEFLTPDVELSLRFLSIGLFFFSLSMTFHNLMQMKGKSKLILTNILIVAFLNLILNIFLIPKYGISGAAFSTMIGNIILSIFLVIQVKYYTSVTPIRRKMGHIFLSAIISSSILILLNNFLPRNNLTILIQGIFFILLYFFLILTTKSLDKNDLMILKSFKRKMI